MFIPNTKSFIKSYSEFVELSDHDKGYQRTVADLSLLQYLM